MAYDAQDIQSLIVLVTWLCISVDAYINPRFRAVFPAVENLRAVLPQLSLSFCDGLFDIIQADNAPSIDWFLSLPSDIPRNLWGIYVLVLRKGSRYKLYIGSGTGNFHGGVRTRILQHQNRTVEPSLVRTAKRQGYKQVHSSLLAWCNRPGPAQVPLFRTALVAVEAALHLIFWPMYKTTTRYNFPESPWPRDSLEWAGLCSHNPLAEGVINGVDNIEFTAEQLEAMAAAARQQSRVVRQAYDRKLRANKTPAYRAARLRYSRTNQPKAAAKGKLDIANKRFHCKPCNHTARNGWGLRRHEATPRHASVVADGCGLYCEPCGYQAKDRNVLHRHQSSQRHAARVKAAQSSS